MSWMEGLVTPPGEGGTVLAFLGSDSTVEVTECSVSICVCPLEEGCDFSRFLELLEDCSFPVTPWTIDPEGPDAGTVVADIELII